MRTTTHFQAVIDSPLGHLGISLQDNCLNTICFLPDHHPLITPHDPVTRHVANELHDYFTDASHRFHLPLTQTVTPFQTRLRMALHAIPCGSTQCYGQLAHTLETRPRAIGQACKANPLPI